MALFKVRYKGLSDIRSMSKKELGDVGVGVDGDLRWARPNNGAYGAHNVVFIDSPSDGLLEVLKAEGTFTVSEVKDDDNGPSEGEPIVTGHEVDDTGAVVRDLTTGAESTNPAVPAGTEDAGAAAPRARGQRAPR